MYTEIFEALAEKRKPEIPFIVLTGIDYVVTVKQVQTWENLVTNEKKTTTETVYTDKKHFTPWNPFTNKGPYFLNDVDHNLLTRVKAKLLRKSRAKKNA